MSDVQVIVFVVSKAYQTDLQESVKIINEKGTGVVLTEDFAKRFWSNKMATYPTVPEWTYHHQKINGLLKAKFAQGVTPVQYLRKFI